MVQIPFEIPNFLYCPDEKTFASKILNQIEQYGDPQHRDYDISLIVTYYTDFNNQKEFCSQCLCKSEMPKKGCEYAQIRCSYEEKKEMGNDHTLLKHLIILSMLIDIQTKGLPDKSMALADLVQYCKENYHVTIHQSKNNLGGKGDTVYFRLFTHNDELQKLFKHLIKEHHKSKEATSQFLRHFMLTILKRLGHPKPTKGKNLKQKKNPKSPTPVLTPFVRAGALSQIVQAPVRPPLLRAKALAKDEPSLVPLVRSNAIHKIDAFKTTPSFSELYEQYKSNSYKNAEFEPSSDVLYHCRFCGTCSVQAE